MYTCIVFLLLLSPYILNCLVLCFFQVKTLKDNNAPFQRNTPVKPAEPAHASAAPAHTSAAPEATAPSSNSTVEKIDDHAGFYFLLFLVCSYLEWCSNLRCYTNFSFHTQLVSSNIFDCTCFS